MSGEQVKGLYPAPAPIKAFDWSWETFGFDNMVRAYAEAYEGDQLARVVRELPNILREAKRVLPENGPEFLKAVNKLSLDVLILSKQGVSNAEIAAALFAKNQKPGKQS